MGLTLDLDDVVIGSHSDLARAELDELRSAARRLLTLAKEITTMDKWQLEAHRSQFNWRMLRAACDALSAALAGDDKTPPPQPPLLQDTFQKGR